MKLFKKEKLSKRNVFNLLVLVMIIGGITGFIYEEIFYYFDLGQLVKRGSTYGPWIPIYAFGSVFITLITYRYKEKPLVVFLLSVAITGVLEYLTGMFFYEVLGTRLWDYNVEILNYGNIKGYVCLRSVLLFGFAGLFLIYYIVPRIIKVIKKADQKVLNRTCNILIVLFGIDIILHMILK